MHSADFLSVLIRDAFFATGLVSFLLAQALWAMQNGYGGTMTFSLNSDDWASTYSSATFPLQRVIANIGSAATPDSSAMILVSSAMIPDSSAMTTDTL